MTQVPPRLATRSWRAPHLVDLAGQVEGIHDLLPVRSAWSSMTAITARARSAKGQAGPSACNSSSLMKSMPALHSTATRSAVSCGENPDRRLDDRADQRSARHAAERPCARHAEGWSGIGCGKGGRQPDVQQAQTGKGLQLEKVAGHCCDRFGSEGPRFSTGQDTVMRACRCGRSGRPAPGSEGAGTSPSGVMASTRAAARALSSGVSPGTGTKVPEDCSPASIAAASSSGQAVSIR
jgi:hypothetical protein